MKTSIDVCLPPALEEFLCWLVEKGFSAWIIGGAVRNALLGIPPRDWDVVTDAPQEVIVASPFKVIPLGARFGVILIVLDGMPVEVASIRETTPQGTLEADMARRDFTINAIALSYRTGEVIDLFGGMKDLKRGIIKGVVDPEARFLEDPLRVIRAARFLSEYRFTIERKTYLAMKKTAHLLEGVAIERTRDEFFKLLLGDYVKDGLEVLRKTGAFKVFLPEILEGWMKKQNNFHSFHIYRHIIETVAYTPPRLRLRLGALFHDIAKPRVRQKIGERFRFFGHEKLSANMAEEILTRWKASRSLVEEVVTLVKNHMVHRVHEWSDSAIRRLINRVGDELLEDFLCLLRADRIAHGVDPVDTSEVDLLERRIEQLKGHYPHSVRELAVNGHDVMEILKIGPGPQVGKVLSALYRHVINHPEDNERQSLLEIIPLLWESITRKNIDISRLV
ncbi:MAG: HD domain-containing protein [Syntrophobacterales bacterium]|nr:HD domain-containing protein [Syntrophobacterales bacterium]